MATSYLNCAEGFFKLKQCDEQVLSKHMDIDAIQKKLHDNQSEIDKLTKEKSINDANLVEIERDIKEFKATDDADLSIATLESLKEIKEQFEVIVDSLQCAIDCRSKTNDTLMANLKTAQDGIKFWTEQRNKYLEFDAIYHDFPAGDRLIIDHFIAEHKIKSGISL